MWRLHMQDDGIKFKGEFIPDDENKGENNSKQK